MNTIMDRTAVKITVLSENSVGASLGLCGEWGLALLLETAGKRILFDTGEQGHLVTNADALGIELRTMDALVLSHGHYDHTGGMRAFLRRRGHLPVYAHPGIYSLHYKSLPHDQYIGVPYCREELTGLGAEFVFTSEAEEIMPGLWVSGEVPRKTDFEKEDSRLFINKEGQKIPDPFVDDMSLYCVIPEGLVIIMGCAHAGLVNIVEHGRAVTGINRVYGIIGGTHLGPAPPEQQEATIKYLQGLDLQFLAANHCTGLPMSARLAGVFGPVFRFAPAGSAFELPATSKA